MADDAAPVADGESDRGGDGNDGWIAIEGVGEPDELLEIGDVDHLTELTHALRSRIMRALRHPRSAAELAGILEMPVTRLYHHINRLEQLGFIRVVATRKVAAVTERRYQVVAKSMNVDKALLQSTDRRELGLALGSIFDSTKLSFQREVEHGLLADHALEDNTMLASSTMALTPERRSEFRRRLVELMEEFAADAEDGESTDERLEVFLAVFPTMP